MHLSLATEAQKQQRDRLTHAAWGQTLSVPDFCARELRLRAHPWTAAGMQTWLLTTEPGGAGEVLASCETFHNDSFLRGEGSTLEPGDSWSIASVYTEERLRGRLLSYDAWRRTHYATFGVWGTATVHGIASGTDRSQPDTPPMRIRSGMTRSQASACSARISSRGP